jgi:hypothetical protein
MREKFLPFTDKPDQFLWDLAAISCFNDRLTCFMFQFRFADCLADIENRLHIIRSVCEFLTSSEQMKRMFAGGGAMKSLLHVSKKISFVLVLKTRNG